MSRFPLPSAIFSKMFQRTRFIVLLNSRIGAEKEYLAVEKAKKTKPSEMEGFGVRIF